LIFNCHNSTNISQQVVETIHDREGLVPHIFPTRFNQAQFINLVDRVNPDLIIGLGQYPRGKKLRIETIAHNHYSSTSTQCTSWELGHFNIMLALPSFISQKIMF